MPDFVNLDNEQANLLNFLNSVKDVLGDAPAQESAIADLNQTISGTYQQSEVQAISDKVDAILAALRSIGLIAT